MQAIYAFKLGQNPDKQLSKDLLEKDAALYKKRMIKDIDNIYDEYLLILLLLISLSDFVEIEEKMKKERLIKPKPTPHKKLKFLTNKIIEKLRNNEMLQSERKKKSIRWKPYDSIVFELYNKTLRKDKKYLEYLELPARQSKALTAKAVQKQAGSKKAGGPAHSSERPELQDDVNEVSFEDDREIVKHILKHIILKDALTMSYYEDMDMNWHGNKHIVESMVLNTLKSVTCESNESFPLAVLSQNWKEDKVFFEDLYYKTIDNDDEYEKLISKRAKNWKIERIAAVDRILLKMAISEMINFPDIPIKVTINEFLEIAALYSTPKSKMFINGILDNIAHSLIKNGVIRKSGKGVIDNK